MILCQLSVDLWGSECMCPGKVECACVCCMVCVQSMLVARDLCMCECVAYVCVLECQILIHVWFFGGLWC